MSHPYGLCLRCGVAAYCATDERCLRCGYRLRTLSFPQLIHLLVCAVLIVVATLSVLVAR